MSDIPCNNYSNKENPQFCLNRLASTSDLSMNGLGLDSNTNHQKSIMSTQNDYLNPNQNQFNLDIDQNLNKVF